MAAKVGPGRRVSTHPSARLRSLTSQRLVDEPYSIALADQSLILTIARERPIAESAQTAPSSRAINPICKYSAKPTPNRQENRKLRQNQVGNDLRNSPRQTPQP